MIDLPPGYSIRHTVEGDHLTVVEAIGAMEAGRAKVFVGLGGNFAVAAPDPTRTFAAMRKLDMAVHVATKPNRTHLLVGKAALLLPCLGRTEMDVRGGVRRRQMDSVPATRELDGTWIAEHTTPYAPSPTTSTILYVSPTLNDADWFDCCPCAIVVVSGCVCWLFSEGRVSFACDGAMALPV